MDVENLILHLKLKISKWHKEWLKRGRSGEILINEDYVYIPIIVQIDLTKPNKWVAIGINENNATYVSSNGKAGKIITGLKELKIAYANKRRNIQLKAQSSKKFNELMEKYDKQETNKK